MAVGTPAGPQRLDPQEPTAVTEAACGRHLVTADDFVLGDDDGVLFLPLELATEIGATAAAIRDVERNQAARMHLGTTLRSQRDFDQYLSARRSDPAVNFRQHLRTIGGAIEE